MERVHERIMDCPYCGRSPVVYGRGKMFIVACINKRCEHPKSRYDKHRLRAIGRWNAAAAAKDFDLSMQKVLDKET